MFMLPGMDIPNDATRDAPQAWLDGIARSEADFAAGRLVDGAAIKRRMRQSIAEMQAAAALDAAEPEAPAPTR